MAEADEPILPSALRPPAIAIPAKNSLRLTIAERIALGAERLLLCAMLSALGGSASRSLADASVASRAADDAAADGPLTESTPFVTVSVVGFSEVNLPNPKEDNKSFTAAQVGVLMENLEKKIDVALEILTPIPDRLEKIEDRLDTLEGDMKIVKDGIRIVLHDLTKRVEKIETKVFA